MPNTQEELDQESKNWSEVMELAAKYGFIWFSYGGVATLVTSENRTKFGANKQPER